MALAAVSGFSGICTTMQFPGYVWKQPPLWAKAHTHDWYSVSYTMDQTWHLYTHDYIHFNIFYQVIAQFHEWPPHMCENCHDQSTVIWSDIILEAQVKKTWKIKLTVWCYHCAEKDNCYHIHFNLVMVTFLWMSQMYWARCDKPWSSSDHLYQLFIWYESILDKVDK